MITENRASLINNVMGFMCMPHFSLLLESNFTCYSYLWHDSEKTSVFRVMPIFSARDSNFNRFRHKQGACTNWPIHSTKCPITCKFHKVSNMPAYGLIVGWKVVIDTTHARVYNIQYIIITTCKQEYKNMYVYWTDHRWYIITCPGGLGIFVLLLFPATWYETQLWIQNNIINMVGGCQRSLFSLSC